MTRIRILIAFSAAIAVLAAMATVSTAADKKLYATLSGSQEKPPADPDGVASATLTFKAKTVCYDIRPKKAGSTFAAGHIHTGKAGVNGDVLIPLFTTPKKVKGGRLTGCSGTISAATLNKVRAKPANYYLNLHNAKYPGGAIRGQLSATKTS
jgi:hypothetical protein